uniref:Beta propeller domain-containing protein n=1 Tax=uncultured Nocardioidaceae bacterium TaxID=253824 RepID=A0A6J4L7F5_9ACTN|nr:MAG: hypothetical protein AVDCRST_MAG46-1069 [uncultured Nocardioidaceae bacterium]
MRKVIWTAGLAVTALTTTLVVTGGGPARVSLTSPAEAATGLVAFDDCDELARWYRATALEEVTAYGLGDGYHGGPIAFARTSMEGVALAANGVVDQATTDAPVGNGDTGTNVQEAGVDEPDVVKTDGALTYVIDDGHLVVTDVTGAEPQEIGRLELARDLRGAELLLVGDRVVLFSSAMPDWGWGGEVLTSRIYPAGPTSAVMAVVDVADPSSMSMLSHRRIDGSVLAAREHNGTVRVVISSQPALDFVYPGVRWDLPGVQRREADELTPAEALSENRRIIEAADAQAFLPEQRVDGGAAEPLLDCDDVTHPEDNAGLGTISVLTMDPADPSTVDSTAISADGDQVYASSDRLYVATTAGGWWSWEAGDRSSEVTTEVHAFDITQEETSYVASGEVPGYVQDRWSFSEHEGRLRIATTSDGRESASSVTVLDEQGPRLDVVGSVGGMGEGEEIQSVRWFDDLAIVVTFRQTDPLYTVDLSDPTAPAVLGELKIPGFSAYLHPVGEDLLLGVGQEATDRGWTTGSQASTFDISDLSEPSRVTALGLGAHRYSTVEDDPRSFTYLAEQGIALVPVDGWRGDESRLAALRVHEDGTLTHAGSLAIGRTIYGMRALPLPDGRIAIVAGGSVVELADPQQLEP